LVICACKFGNQPIVDGIRKAFDGSWQLGLFDITKQYNPNRFSAICCAVQVRLVEQIGWRMYPMIKLCLRYFGTYRENLCVLWFRRTMSAKGHVWTAPSWQEFSSRLQHWSVHLKYRLGDVETDCRNHLHA
jgi:hypothetical protein